MKGRVFTLLSMFLIYLVLGGINIQNLIISLIISALLYVLSSMLGVLSNYRLRVTSMIIYFSWLIQELFKSSLFVTRIILSKKIIVEPTFFLLRIKKADLAVIYSHCITLTPGTLAINIKNNEILIHVLKNISIMSLNNSNSKTIKKISSFIK